MIGLVIGVSMAIGIKAYAQDTNSWFIKTNYNDILVTKFRDGDIQCYLSESKLASVGISCVDLRVGEYVTRGLGK